MPEAISMDVVSRDWEYRRVAEAVQRYPWAILPEKLQEIASVLETRFNGGVISNDQIQAAVGSRKDSNAIAKRGSIAVVPLFGSIFQRANIVTQASGGTSTEMLGATLEELANDETIAAIVLDVDSPGGNTAGVPELAAKIMELRSKKKIIAVANTLMASAAYWLASAASELIAAPSALVGSIGVIAMHVDNSKAIEESGRKVTLITAGKFKGEGSPYEPLSETAREGMQTLVNDYYKLFVSAVASHRGVSSDEVKAGFGEGRVVLASEAVRLGMVDKVETLEQTLRRLSAETETRHIVGISGHRVSLLERDLETY